MAHRGQAGGEVVREGGGVASDAVEAAEAAGHEGEAAGCGEDAGEGEGAQL